MLGGSSCLAPESGLPETLPNGLETAPKMPEQIDVDSDPKHLKIVHVETLESDHDSEILRIMNSKDTAANGR